MVVIRCLQILTQDGMRKQEDVHVDIAEGMVGDLVVVEWTMVVGDGDE